MALVRNVLTKASQIRAKALTLAITLYLVTSPAHALINAMGRGETLMRRIMLFVLFVAAAAGLFIFISGVMDAIKRQQQNRTDIETKQIFGKMLGGAALAIAATVFGWIVTSISGGGGAGSGAALPF